MKPASGRRAAGLELGLLPPRFAVTMEYGRPFPFRSSFVDTEHLPRAKHCAEAVGMQRRYGTGPALSFRRGRRGRWTRSAGQPVSGQPVSRGVEGMRMPVAENRGQEEGGQASPGLHP